MGLVTDIIKGLPLTAVMDEKIKTLEKEISKIENERDGLRARCSSLEKENADLRTQIQAVLAPRQRRSSIEEDILGYLWNKDAQYAVDVGRVLSMVKDKAAFHLDELEKAELVHCQINMFNPPRYVLTQEGKRYLLDKGLVK
jgi:predicted transcriptional regulator